MSRFSLWARGVVAWCLALTVSPALALDGTRAIHHYVLEHWSTREGLPQNTLLAADQTTDGYLWFATYEGLARFDGVRFKVFDRSAYPVFRRNAVLSVAARPNGGLLFGNPGVVASALGSTVTALIEDAGREQLDIWALLEDPKGRIWVGTRTEGLQVLEKGRLRAVPERLADAHVRALALDPSGTLWVGTMGQGLVTLRDGIEVACRACRAIPAGGIHAITTARDGGVWVGGTFGLVRVTAEGDVIRQLEIKSEVESVRDSDSGVWVAHSSGLARLHGGKVEEHPAFQGRPANVLLFDREGSLWVGVGNDGIYRLRDAPFSMMNNMDGLPSEFLSTVAAIGESTWVSSRTALFHRGPGDRRFAGRAAPGIRNVVLFNGELVFAGPSGEVQVDRQGRTMSFGLKDDTKAEITLLAATGDGLWVGRRDGTLREFVDGRSRRAIRIPGLYGVTGMHIEPDGRILIASYRGLFEWTHGQVRDLTPSLKAPLVVGTGLVARPDGTVWLLSDGNGLFRIRGQDIRNVTSGQGLFDDVVFTMIADELGYFWLTSNKGIARVNEAELNAVADGKQARLFPRAFGVEDGLASVECVGGGRSARTPDGRLWFPTIAGVAVVDPRDLRVNGHAPFVHVESVKVDGREVGNGAVVAPGVESVEIAYTATSFRIPSRVHFRTRLEGYDSSVTDAGNLRIAYYKQLPRGDYQFVVDAFNEDGVKALSPASFAFSVAPRFHERTSVRFGFALLALGGIFSVFRMRTAALRERQRTLETLVTERTQALAVEKERALAASRAKSRFVASVSHELRTPLHAILGFTDLLGRPGGSARRDEYLELISSSGAHLLGLVNSVLSLTKIEEGHGEVEKAPFQMSVLIDEVTGTMRPRAEGKGLRLLTDVGDLPPWVLGDAAKVRQILINLVGNAVKFTTAGYVTLHVSREDSHTTFEVEDSGAGIPESQRDRLFEEFSQTDTGARSGEGTGLGLAISRRLARLMAGDLVLASSSQGGSTFALRLDLPRVEAPATSARRRAIGVDVRPKLGALLVADDTAPNRRLLRDLLAVVELDVIEAVDGPSAFAAFEAHHPPLVFTDAIMPGYGGLELARRIRALEAEKGWPRTPVIAVTASVLGDERQQLIVEGCDLVIAKPFDANEIFSALEAYLELRIRYEDTPLPTSHAGLTRTPTRAPGHVAVASADVDRLEAVLLRKDWSLLRRTAHDFKGAASMTGDAGVAELFGEVESQAFGARDEDAIALVLARLRRIATDR